MTERKTGLPWIGQKLEKLYQEESQRLHTQLVIQVKGSYLSHYNQTLPDFLEQALARVSRHLYISRSGDDIDFLEKVYSNQVLPLNKDWTATSSQPSLMCWMIQHLIPDHVIPSRSGLSGLEVLDVGSGGGYGAALLAELGLEVVGVEYDSKLAEKSRLSLEADNRLKLPDGSGKVRIIDEDIQEFDPKTKFDGIVVGVAVSSLEVWNRLIGWLKPGCNLVVPISPSLLEELIQSDQNGSWTALPRYVFSNSSQSPTYDHLVRYTQRTDTDEVEIEDLGAVTFVRMRH